MRNLLSLLFVASSCCLANAAAVTLSTIQTRAAGPIASNVALTAGGTFGSSHGLNPGVWNFTVSNQDLDGDGMTNDSFTFDLIATPTTGTLSIWGQGISKSNSNGTGNSFNDADGITLDVGNVVGTTSEGDSIVFDGFTGLRIASGSGSVSSVADNNRSIDINGTNVGIDVVGSENGFVFTQQQTTFGPVLTVVLDNQGAANSGRAASGTLVIRTVDLQFSSADVTAVPEPSLAFFAVAMVGLCLRRRRLSK